MIKTLLPEDKHYVCVDEFHLDYQYIHGGNALQQLGGVHVKILSENTVKTIIFVFLTLSFSINQHSSFVSSFV